ncbi:TrmH family RNA methyltransferase [Bacteriovorax sp. DB6_IX]|uniref:TrmH family RNA methyltransferase n=1 Tax=Bacteriovorax sp. DB6_IX TaxID=1353530 RepID=UPI00038A05C2|nr:TrmH family RNA methyltransferase [Bacteriovorax sp. DB6_IX]EQC50690.1 RNA methyltransferase, TrmH family [Bacteriovorax sp. DB6_IX]
MGKKKTRAFLQKKFEKELEINLEKSKEGIHELIIVLDHLKGNFNMGKIMRSAEIYSVKEVHIIGTKFFDPTPAKGALKRVKTYFYHSFDESAARIKELGFSAITFDSKATEYLNDCQLPEKSAFIFGHEEFGPMYDKDQFEASKVLKIKQYGLTESLNVSIAATISMYEYTNQHGKEISQ